MSLMMAVNQSVAPTASSSGQHSTLIHSSGCFLLLWNSSASNSSGSSFAAYAAAWPLQTLRATTTVRETRKPNSMHLFKIRQKAGYRQYSGMLWAAVSQTIKARLDQDSKASRAP